MKRYSIREMRLSCTLGIVQAWLVIVGISTCWAQHEPAQLLSFSRSGGQLGTTVELRVATGNQLLEIDALHFSNPAVSAELKTLEPLPFTQLRLPDYGNFNVTIPSDLPPGRYEVRASGRHGISNPRSWLISNLPNEFPAQISHDASSPTPLAISTLLHARSTAAEVDYYGISIVKDQPLQVELLAQQLDSRMIGQLILFDAEGHQVASARGADDVDPSMRTSIKLPTGDYVLAVHDFLYRGGPDYHYQVLVRPIEQAEALIKPDESAEGQLPKVWATRSFALRKVHCLENVQQASAEPRTIEIPFAQSQWFPDQQQDAIFELNAKEGDVLTFDVASQRVGQPTDARLTVQRVEPQESGVPKLHELLNVDDCQSVSDGAINLFSTDAVALLTVPATATYRVCVRDLDVGKSLLEQQAFHLRVGPPDPGFDLVAYRPNPHRDVNQTQPLGSKIFRGGTELIRVFAIRRDGWTGPIKIRCEGLPPGVTASDAIIAANQSQTQLTLTAAEDAPGGSAPIRVIGRSEDGSIEQQAIAATIQWGKGAGRDFIQSRLTSSIWASVSENDTSPLSITLGDGTPAEVKKGETLKLPVKLVRREGGQAACVVRPLDLPGGVKAGEMTIPAESSEGEIEFKVEAGATPGTYSLWAQCETKIKLKPNPQSLERAQQYRSLLQSLHDDPAQATNLEAIKTAIAEADKRVEAAKGMANEKELTVFLPTSIATIRVIEP